MSDSRSLNDRFARGAAPGGNGFGRANDTFAKPSATSGDAFAQAPKSVPAAKSQTPSMSAHASMGHDAFAAKAQPARPTADAFGRKSPPQPRAAPPKMAELISSAPKLAGLTAPAVAVKTNKIVRPKSPGLQPVLAGSRRQTSLMVKPTPVTAPKSPSPKSPPPKSPLTSPMLLPASTLAATKSPHASGFYNPFSKKPPPKPPRDSAPRDMFDPDPGMEFNADPSPEPAESKHALHVVANAPATQSVSAIGKATKSRGAARASSLVLVSGAGAVAAATAAEAPVIEKPPEPEAPVAETPPKSEPAPAAQGPAAKAEPGRAFWSGGRGGPGGGSGGGGSGKGPGASATAKPLFRRGINQDDIFGVVFGIAVLAFLLMWFMRGRGEEAPGDDLLATTQSTTVQSLAAMPPPAPAPKVDPFGNAPVDLTPSGPIPEAPAAAAPTPAPVAPAIASPPVVAANPEATIPVAERKMHAWFCTASSRMTKASRTELTGEMAKFADVFAGQQLIVRGYADTRGSTELNADLSSRRAQGVADYLTSKGLSVVDVQGVGELDGLDDNQNCPNQRRVDVWVKGGPAETPSRACAPEPEVEALICG